MSNKAAIHLYRERLRYDQNGVEAKYYADGEDAYDMRKTFKKLAEEVEKTGGDGTLIEKLRALAV